MEEFQTKDDIFHNASKHPSERFRVAFSALCYSGKLFDDVGFLCDTMLAMASKILMEKVGTSKSLMM